MDRSDLAAKNQTGGGIASEKGGVRILDEEEERHPFCCLSFLYCVNPSMLVYSSNPFVCWWSVTNCIVNDLNGTGQRNRKNCFCGNGGGFFGCFVG